MEENGCIDVGIRDVNAYGVIPWNYPSFKGKRETLHRVVRIDAADPVLFFYRGEIVSRPFRSKVVQCTSPSPAERVFMFGSIGLNLGWDTYGFSVSVEAAALIRLLRGKSGNLPFNKVSWHDSTVFVCMCGNWRGCVSEYRLWCSLYYFIEVKEGDGIPRPDMEAHLPLITGWYPERVLSDIVSCVGERLILKLLKLESESGYEGAPDLCIWTEGHVEFGEVKSSTDSIRQNQVKLIRELRKVAKCAIYCTSTVGTAVQKRCMVSNGSDSDTE